ncbi:MAG TPA: biotin--[acetyl-CoA-carboxylase] ligase [Rhodanobacteraceae bacterium]|nr:biotin--[acetyl-CoA-carboxylase] ligase [Rhodanobacteraceae bacterium]
MDGEAHSGEATAAAGFLSMLRCLGDGEARSGADLARQLGIGRAAVWKRVQALRARGVPVEGRTGLGYRLPWPVELLDAVQIGAALPAAARQRLGALRVLAEVDSTSSEARRAALPDMGCVLAECQRAGRGRRGRGWLSPPGLNLYVSCVKRFESGMAALSGLSLAVGVMLVQAVGDAGIEGVGLKWPNDLLGAPGSAAPGAKLGGILVELDGEVGGPCSAVIGIGLNLRLPPALRQAAGQAASDLAEFAGGQPPPRNRMAARLIARLIDGLARFEQHGFAAFADEYARHDLLRDRPVRVQMPREVLLGHGAGIDAGGALRLRTGDGVVVVDSAEVSVRGA